MATNIKILTVYELNQQTYRGSFPIYVSDVICDVDATEDFQSQLQLQLAEIAED